MPTKDETLQSLKTEMGQDSSLPLFGMANFVFGEGDPNAEVLFIGEAPGFHEDRLGRPFVGLAGQLLDKLLEEVNWLRGSVYITNIVKRRPPQNRDPLPDEIGAYAPYLARQIEALGPKIIVTLGRFSMNYFLPDAKISRDHGWLMKARTYFIFPLYHPAAALRSTNVLNELRTDFHKLPEALGQVKSGTISANKQQEKEKVKQTSLF